MVKEERERWKFSCTSKEEDGGTFIILPVRKQTSNRTSEQKRQRWKFSCTSKEEDGGTFIILPVSPDILRPQLDLCKEKQTILYSRVMLINVSRGGGDSNSFHLEKFGSHNRLSLFNGVESDNFASSHSYISSNKVPVSRSQVSAPPGFSVPSRVPPPGFISHEKTGRIFDPHSGNYMPDASLLPRNRYQASPSGDSISNAEIEFMDPAILAVGKGILPGSLNSSGLGARLSYSPQYSTLEELRFQSLLQRSVPTHQNQRFTDPGDSYSPLGDAYGVPSRVLEQTLTNNLSPFSQFTLPQPRNAVTSNGQWDGWNTVQGENALGMAELLRNERLGLPKYYNGYEDSNTRLPNSGNLYNRANGI
ncbi:uncharacterized protein LOC111371043 [Olea europaea var. sylvestris]|uniref:uncharacterized protein LOC111371043 n=1 Tax=Olea europaea var. sylvestris TaxID=158386 RepID=UPI000C1D5A59|nr:uncharacterized protein LOC111371043 [Olea europaea var. sylvestris]